MSEQTPEKVVELAKKRIAERTEEENAIQQQRYEEAIDQLAPWRYAFISVLSILLLGLLFLPGASLAQKMYIVLHGMCSQEHNIILGGIQFPICARCTGIYISAVITLIYFWALRRGLAGRVAPWYITGVMIFFVLAMVVDGFHSMSVGLGLWKFYEPRNDVRTLTGIGVGIGIAVLLLMMINTVLRNNADDNMHAFENWREFIGAVILNFLVLVAIYGNLNILAMPLATLAFLGMAGVVYIVNLILVSLVLGYDGKISRLPQLAKPATIAIIPTILMIGGTSFFRYWLEAQGVLPQV